MELILTGAVGYAPIDLQTVRAALEACAPNETLTLRVNSEGGDAFVGESIRAMLAGSTVETVCAIEGMCASAAVTIAMGAKRVTMTENSALMIHRSSVSAHGTASDLASSLQLLEAVDAGLVALYTARTGRSERVVRAWLEAQTWFTADEAKAAGLVHEVVAAKSVAANLGKLEAPAHIRVALDAAVRVVQSTPMAYPATLLTKLGLPAEATEDQVLAALDAAMIKPAAAPPAAINAADVARIVGEQLAAQRAAAEASATPDVIASAHQAAAVALVERFITERKITPAGRDKAIAACSSGPQALAACSAFWESAPVVVASAANLPAPGSKPTLSALDKLLCKGANITEEQFLAQKGLKNVS